jgi:hypothetical protein
MLDLGPLRLQVPMNGISEPIMERSGVLVFGRVKTSDCLLEGRKFTTTHYLEIRKLDDSPETPLPTANEGQLSVARGELRTAYAELEKLTIRAPIVSTVLQQTKSLPARYSFTTSRAATVG